MEGKRLFLQDADDLLKAWEETLQVRSASFLSFKQLWREKDFSFIHEGRPKDLDRKAFLQTLYTACWEVIRGTENSLAVQVGALYMIYLLYETQPGSYRQRVKVYTSTDDLKALHALMAAACEHQLVDVAQVANQLIHSGALLFGAVLNHLNADALRGPAAEVQRMRARLLPTEGLNEHFESNLGDLLPLSKMDQDIRQYNDARKRMVAAGQEDSPHLSLAEDLLRSSAALERQVRIALNPSKSGKAPAKKASKAPADVSARGLVALADVAPRQLVDVRTRGLVALADMAPRQLADVSTRGPSAPADVGRVADVAPCQNADVSTTPQVMEAPEPVADVAPLPVQSMPSIPGLAGFSHQPMEVEQHAIAAEDGDEIDVEELEREIARLSEVEDMEHDQPETAAEETRDSSGLPVDDPLIVKRRESRTRFEHTNGSGDGHLGMEQRSNGWGKTSEVGHENGVLDRRWNGTGEEVSSDSDDEMEIRRPLPRALLPLL